MVTSGAVIIDGEDNQLLAPGPFTAWGKFVGGPMMGTTLDYPTALPGGSGSYGLNIYVCNPVKGGTGRPPEWFWDIGYDTPYCKRVLDRIVL